MIWWFYLSVRRWAEVVNIINQGTQIADKYQDIKELIKQFYNHHKGSLGCRHIDLIIR